MLKQDPRFKTLCDYVLSEIPSEPRKTPKGRVVSIHELNVQFPDGDKKMIPNIEILEHRYGEKGIVNVLDEQVYGEIAILKCLQKDGWQGIWIANFGGIHFWDAMPQVNGQVLFGDIEFDSLPQPLQEKHTEIQKPRGKKKGGFFDVFAYKGNDFIFMEYKVGEEKANRNELAFIDAALDAGVNVDQLVRVRRI